MKNFKTDGLFPLINWVLKKKITLNQNLGFPSVYMLNRWLSMADSTTTSIINHTVNRWVGKTAMFSDTLKTAKFLKVILPRVDKKITYLKKTSTKDSSCEENNKNEAIYRECSLREVVLNKKLLENIKKINK